MVGRRLRPLRARRFRRVGGRAAVRNESESRRKSKQQQRSGRRARGQRRQATLTARKEEQCDDAENREAVRGEEICIHGLFAFQALSNDVTTRTRSCYYYPRTLLLS